MDRSVSLQLNETVDEDVNTDIMDNRFFNELNTDCHLEVLQYLDVTNLLRLSKVDIYFEEIIKRWIVGNKSLTLEVSDVHDITEVLKVFGQAIRKIKVIGNDYNFLIETIRNYCKPDIMIDIEIIVEHIPLSKRSKRAKRSFPLCTNLQTLRIDDYNGLGANVVHLKQIARSALNLKVLKVRGCNIDGEWLRTKYLKNLSELWMSTSNQISVDDLTYFIREHPKLQVFSFAGVNDIEAIGDSLSKYCKNLKEFYYDDTSHIQEDGIANLVNTLKDESIKKASNRFGFLSSFTDLNAVTFNSCRYLNDSLISLASKYSVKELDIYINFNGFQNRCTFKHLIDYQTVEIHIQKHANLLQKREPCQSSFQCIVYIVSRMKNLQKITLRCGKILSNLYKILEMLPNIQTFSISNVYFLHLPVEIFKLVNTIRKHRQSRPHQDLLHLIVSVEQYRELAVFEKEGIMTISIDQSRSSKRRHM